MKLRVAWTPPNKGRKLTKLSAAPLLVRRCRLMPALVDFGRGHASQLIPPGCSADTSVREPTGVYRPSILST